MAVLVTASGNYATHCVTMDGGTTYGGIYGTLRNSCWWASTCVYLLCPPRAAQNPLHIVSTSCSLSSYSLHIAHCTLLHIVHYIHLLCPPRGAHHSQPGLSSQHRSSPEGFINLTCSFIIYRIYLKLSIICTCTKTNFVTW